MTFKRVGSSYIDPDPRRAERDRDHEAAIQDLQGVEVELTTPATPDQEFRIVHNLRSSVPRAIEVLRRSNAGAIYASRVADWDGQRIFAKCSTASNQVLLRVR